jgi:acetylornithine deacetylase/succinyl-diaminopimelate desuccinylase-like protein
MAQMHQPDEFITEAAIDEGLTFLDRLLAEMTVDTVQEVSG